MKKQRLKAIYRLTRMQLADPVTFVCACTFYLSVRAVSACVFHSSDSLTIGKWPTSLPLFISPSICLFFFPVSAAQSSLHCTEWPLFSVHWRHPGRERLGPEWRTWTVIQSQFVWECDCILPKFDLSENLWKGEEVVVFVWGCECNRTSKRSVL